MEYIKSKKDLIEEFVLVSYNRSSGLTYPSTQYTFSGLIQSLQVMGVEGFGADFQFSLWEGEGEKWLYGLVNLAAFLVSAGHDYSVIQHTIIRIEILILFIDIGFYFYHFVL